MADSALSDAINRQAEAIERQTDLLGQIAGALFQIAGEQESEEESEPDTYLDGSPR